MGFDDPSGWRTDSTYQGATIGRYANRIDQGTFELDGTTYSVPRNHGNTALHGGPGGFETQQWDVDPVIETALGHERHAPPHQSGRRDGLSRGIWMSRSYSPSPATT